MILVYELSSAESFMKLYSSPSCVKIGLPFFASSIDITSIEEKGIEAGAVKYHICFPSKFDFFNNCDALDVPSKDARSNPGGGWYGAGAVNETVLVVGCFEGFLVGSTDTGAVLVASSESSSSSLLSSLSSLPPSLELLLPEGAGILPLVFDEDLVGFVDDDELSLFALSSELSSAASSISSSSSLSWTNSSLLYAVGGGVFFVAFLVFAVFSFLLESRDFGFIEAIAIDIVSKDRGIICCQELVWAVRMIEELESRELFLNFGPGSVGSENPSDPSLGPVF